MASPRPSTARGVDHVGITVPSIKAATEFFASAFGAVVLYDLLTEPVQGPEIESALGLDADTVLERIRMLHFGNGPSVELFEYSGTPQRQPVIPSDFGLQHFAVYVDDIDAAADAVEAAGGRLHSRPLDLPGGDAGPGNKYLYFLTPWGSSMELVSYPSPQAYEAGTSLRRWRPVL